MKLRVLADRCTGHGRCYDLAPELFDEDEDGHCLLRVSVVSGDLEAKARVAAQNCPEEAIVVSD